MVVLLKMTLTEDTGVLPNLIQTWNMIMGLENGASVRNHALTQVNIYTCFLILEFHIMINLISNLMNRIHFKNLGI